MCMKATLIITLLLYYTLAYVGTQKHTSSEAMCLNTAGPGYWGTPPSHTHTHASTDAHTHACTHTHTQPNTHPYK